MRDTRPFSDTVTPKTAVELALLEEIKNLRVKLWIHERASRVMPHEVEPISLVRLDTPPTITLSLVGRLAANVRHGHIEVEVRGGSGDTAIGAVYSADVRGYDGKPDAAQALRYASHLNEEFQARLAAAVADGKFPA